MDNPLIPTLTDVLLTLLYCLVGLSLMALIVWLCLRDTRLWKSCSRFVRGIRSPGSKSHTPPS